MTSVVSIPAPAVVEPVLVDPVADTAWDEVQVAALNALLAATEGQEGRLAMSLNRFGQWCTRGVGGWRPHATYMHAWKAAYAEEVA